MTASATASLLKAFRVTHRYLGAFAAPALVFFAFSGSLQTFNLHDTKKGNGYVPPAWVLILARIHKDQTAFALPKKPVAPSPSVKPKPAAAAGPATPVHNPLPLKIFFLLVALGLFTSTVTGVWMAYKFERQKWIVTALLLAGVIIPVAMLLTPR